jgi:20S proteasome alpha/beta subunit
MQAPALAAMGQAPVRPETAFIVGGYEMDGTPRMYQLVSSADFSPMLHDYGFAVSGVAQYALYLLNTLYEPDRSVQELTALGVFVITETAGQDGKVGGPVNVITVDPSEGCEALDQAMVENIISTNEGRSRSLRDSFYDRDE